MTDDKPNELRATRIGVAGCGRMGLPMLRRLQGAGLDAVGFDIREVGVLTDPAKFSDRLQILISVVRDVNETDALLFDTQALATCPTLEAVVLCSTLPPPYVAAVAKRLPRHLRLIDAPMSGAQVRAEAGTLTFMIGGPAAEKQRLRPMFDAMGETCFDMGASGYGMTAKVLNNLLAAASTAMTREVLSLADQIGMPEDQLLRVIAASSGQNWLASGFDEIEFARDGHAEDNSIGILVKDVEAALSLNPADPSLARAVQNTLRQLGPRS